MTKLISIFFLLNFIFILLIKSSEGSVICDGLRRSKRKLKEAALEEFEDVEVPKIKQTIRADNGQPEVTVNVNVNEEERSEQVEQMEQPPRKRRETETDIEAWTEDEEEVDYEEVIYNSLKTAIEGVKSRNVIDYPNEPETDFFDKLIRGSISYPLKQVPDDTELWDMPCTSRLSAEFHTTAFYYILSNKINFSEECLVEYFLFIYDNWICGYEDVNGQLETLLIRACELAIPLKFLDLFEIAFAQIEQEDSALKVLTALRNDTLNPFPSDSSSGSIYKWQMMCLAVIRRFPRLAYHLNMRLQKFQGAELPERFVFIHFLPILRTLLITNTCEFEADSEAFEDFILFHLGNLTTKLPMGVGGLKIINEMFLRSKINLSAFETPEKLNLKSKIIERLFDGIFLGMETGELVELTFEKGTFSIFEAYMKYSMNIRLNKASLTKILTYLLKNTKDYKQFYFIKAFMTYMTIPKTIWNALNKSCKETFVNQAQLIYKINEKASANLDLNRDETIQIPIKESKKLNQYSNRNRFPFQLDAARVFLARACGVPLEMTEVLKFTMEGFEWWEVVAFINFYVERAAGLALISDGHLKFVA